MVVNNNCHLNKILSHLRDKPLGMARRYFLGWVTGNGKVHSECGQRHPMGWSPGVNGKEKVSASIHLSVLLDCRCNVTRCLML